MPESTIKGAYSFSQEEHLMEKRSDGVAPNGAMVASGAKVDKFLSKYGIDNNTLIVLTSHDLTNQMVYRAFWALKYWGFYTKQQMTNHCRKNSQADYGIQGMGGIAGNNAHYQN